MRKDKFKRKIQSELSPKKHKSSSPKGTWTEDDYDTYVKTVRRHGLDHTKILEALPDKNRKLVKRFTRALC